MVDERSGATIPGLFTEVLSQLTHLFRTELRLFKTELAEKVTSATAAAGMIVVGAVLGIGALYLFLQGIVLLLVSAGVAPQWATFGVAVVVGLAGYLVARKGLGDLSASNLAPERTMQSLNRDAAVAKEQVQ
jgi:hypothetical protein